MHHNSRFVKGSVVQDRRHGIKYLLRINSDPSSTHDNGSESLLSYHAKFGKKNVQQDPY